jgi:hypothetical protein
MSWVVRTAACCTRKPPGLLGGMNLMTRIAQDLDELGSVEAEPKFEGRQVIMVLAPRKNRKAQAPKEAS